MIWDSNSSNMEELNVDEWEWTIVLIIFKGTCKQILGPIMDINQLFMDFKFGLSKTKTIY
jgi:hypothetical protein